MRWDALVFVLFLAITLTACTAGRGTAPTPTPEVTAPTAPVPTPAPTPTPDPIAQAVGEMTLEEQVGQLFLVGFEGTTPGADVEHYLTQMKVGGVILFRRNVESAEQLTALTNALKAMNGATAPLFVGVDQEGGLVERMPPEIKKLPSAYNLNCGSDDDRRAELLGQVLAEECAAFGFNLDFAPSFDVWSNPNNTVIGKRAFSSDPVIAADAAVRCAGALRDGGIIPTPKHFPGHGDTDTDSHVGLPVVTKTLEEWKGSDFLPFRTAMDAGQGTMMVGHIVLSALDETHPATLSKAVLTDFLRGEAGYDGVLFTDDMTMGAITQNYGLGEACVLSLEAGCDVLLVCHGRENIQGAYDAVLEAARSGRLTQVRIEESLYRILALKAEYGLTDQEVGPADVKGLNDRVAQVWTACN